MDHKKIIFGNEKIICWKQKIQINKLLDIDFIVSKNWTRLIGRNLQSFSEKISSYPLKSHYPGEIFDNYNII